MWSRIRRAKRCCGLAFYQGATGGRTDAAKSGLGMRESISCRKWVNWVRRPSSATEWWRRVLSTIFRTRPETTGAAPLAPPRGTMHRQTGAGKAVARTNVPAPASSDHN